MARGISVMAFLEQEDVKWIESHGKRMRVTTSQVLIREGEPVDFLFVLLDGDLDIIIDG